jgi:MoaA/NifB/PqqE/SkfB family radical SAM enzyme
MLSKEVIAAYDASRARGTDRSVLCHAPFVSLNFDQSGRVTACCFNRHYVLGTYPEQSVREIWTGAPARALREAFLTGANAPGCDRCFDQLKNRNFSGALMRNFDRYTAGGARAADRDGPPLVLEFEISNTCHLECVMCGGHWSSAIRARREKLPPLANPYDQAFVKQIEEFLPTIAGARFLGGEPFLINRYHEIWDSIRRLNPEARISITTSGATLPDRSRQMLEQLRAEIIVSLDGITAETYESIRVNAKFDEVMENIKYFLDYTHRRRTSLTVAVCPMTHNWHELREIVEFCEQRQITVFFNTVTFPIESSLAGLAAPRLAEVIDRLEGELATAGRSWTAGTRDQWVSLTNQLRGWMDEKRAFAGRCADTAATVRAFAAASLNLDGAPKDGVDTLVDSVVLAYEVERERALARLGQGTIDSALPPQPPLTLWPEGVAPDAHDLLLAAQVVRSFVNTTDKSDSRDALDEYRRLRLFLDQTPDSQDTRARFDRLGAWLRERLRQADVRAAFDIISVIQDASDARHVLLLAEPGELRRKLDEGWERLAADGVEESERAGIQRYFDRLVAFHSLTKFLGTPDAASGVEVELIRRIGSVSDLQAALHGMHLFHLSFGPAAKQDSFRRRLDLVRGALTPERSPVILSALQKTDVTHIYEFLSTVSDEEFASRINAIAS